MQEPPPCPLMSSLPLGWRDPASTACHHRSVTHPHVRSFNFIHMPRMQTVIFMYHEECKPRSAKTMILPCFSALAALLVQLTEGHLASLGMAA